MVLALPVALLPLTVALLECGPHWGLGLRTYPLECGHHFWALVSLAKAAKPCPLECGFHWGLRRTCPLERSRPFGAVDQRGSGHHWGERWKPFGAALPKGLDLLPTDLRALPRALRVLPMVLRVLLQALLRARQQALQELPTGSLRVQPTGLRARTMDSPELPMDWQALSKGLWALTTDLQEQRPGQTCLGLVLWVQLLVP